MKIIIDDKIVYLKPKEFIVDGNEITILNWIPMSDDLHITILSITKK
ncbi:MAG: hypothetical protein HY738_20880 [Bacteroidia bacterium]|nr:hypothetical protein [Bacteroidia bacterium]